jgi:hypothetical protein
MIEDFFHLPPVSTAPVVHIELRIYSRIFEKIRNGPHGILWAWGKLIHKKVENLVTLSLLLRNYITVASSTSFDVR